MDDARAHEISPQLDGLIVEQDTLDAATRNYLARVRPFSLRFDVPAPLIMQELAMRWPIQRGAEEQASNLRHQIEGFVKPLIDSIHPAVTMRLIINVGRNPEVQVPFPDAPTVYAAFDASRGIVRHRFANANQIPLDSWAEAIPRGMTLLCQPTEIKGDQIPNVFGQGDNLYELTAKEQNETADWRREHNRAIIVPMMPFTARSEAEVANDLTHQTHYSLSGKALGAAALFAGYEAVKHFENERNPQREAEEFQKRQKENDERLATQNKENSDTQAEKNKNDAAIQAEQAAMQRTEYLLNEVRRDERLIRENPQLSSELEALVGSAQQLRGTLHDGPGEAQAEADINAAEAEYMLAKEPETSYDENSTPEQIFLGMPEKETEVQESEQAREDAEHFPEEITSPGEYARIADLNPEAAEELTAEEPGLRQYAVKDDLVEAGTETASGEAASAATRSAASDAANEVTLSPEAATERAEATAPEAAAERAAEEIGGTREVPEAASVPEAENAAREEALREGQAVAEAPESKIAEPAASNVEGRELEGGAPLNEAGEPIQEPVTSAEEAAEQSRSPSTEEASATAEDPITEKAQEEMRDEALRTPEPENNTASSERAETNSNETASVRDEVTQASTERTETAVNTETAAPESKIAEPAASNVEGRELEGGAPLNEAGQPIQNAPHPEEQPGSPAVQEETSASAKDPVTEKAQEEMRNDTLRPVESENEAAPAHDGVTQPAPEQTETGRNEAAAAGREPAAENPQPVNAPRAAPTEQPATETVRTESVPQTAASQRETTPMTASPQQTSTEQPAEQTEAVYQGRETPVETARSESEPQKMTASQHGPSTVEDTQPQQTSTEQLPEQTEAVYQGRETPVQTARSDSEPQMTASQHGPSTVEDAQPQETSTEQPAEQTTVERTERVAPGTEQPQETVSATPHMQSPAEESSTPQDHSDGFHDILNVHHMGEALGSAAGLHHAAAEAIPKSSSGTMSKAGAMKAKTLAGRLRPSRQSSSRKAGVVRGAKVKAAPQTTHRPTQTAETVSEPKPEPEPGI